MLLSIAGGTSIATPVNTSIGQGENKVLQAQLGNNLTNASLVAGNSNTVLDTIGTGSWKFYVAGNTSVASISSASASTEWTVGNLLSYSLPLKIYYPLKVPDINPLNALQVGEYSTGTYVYNGTLNNGATIAVETAPAGSRVAGQGYLKVVYASNQYFQFPSFTTGSNGISFAFWFRSNASSANYARIFDCGNGTQTYNISMTIHLNFLSVLVYANGGAPQYINDNITGYSVNDNVWRHVAWILSPNGNYSFYINGALVTTVAAWYPTSILRTGCYLSWTAFGGGGSGINGGIDDFRYYESVLSASDVTNIYGGGNGPIGTIKDATSGVTWIPKTGTVVDSSETSYTVKSTEIALIPGTNSTFAVWTAPTSTNIKVDVSFADYHTRSAGVGFQMFKINADNTFGSTLFPRTVTTLALTDAAPTNYLTVPSTSLSVSTGDKIYLRVDANGNSASASSVLATNIYADPNIDLKQNLYLQAKLGNNVAATTFVSGNANIVNDTLGTGSWKFYVAGNTSVASISSASASTEWTSGSLLSYTLPLSVYYTFNTNKVSGNTITDSVGNYTGTLVNGATISTSNPSPATGSGYLSMNVSLSQYASLSPITNSRVGMSFSFWMRPTTASTPHILSFGNGVLVDNVIFSMISNNYIGIIVKGAAISASGYLSPTNNVSGNDGVWKHIVWTLDPTNVWKFYLNGSLSNSYSGASYYYPNPVTTTTNYIGRSIFGDPYYGGDVDDFRYYGVVLSASDVTNVYGGGTGPTVGKNMDATTGVTWMSTPAIVVNSSETSYTVKSTEIALTPGTNSTFAVWTATKSTNIKVDVSFADYHTRSAGVGFQMFKIKSDNTFDSVLFPRTVTTLALTDAAPTNYLSVPSVTTSMNAGDKLYYRIDANGNTTAASSVLATSIYTDSVSIATNTNENKLLQAQLGNNLTNASLVAGTSNTVLDTIGTGSWKFYVAGNTSVASISSASASTEWTSGSILPYVLPPTVPTDMALWYTMDLNKVTSTTIYDSVGNFTATLVNGATISTANYKYGDASLYLNNTQNYASGNAKYLSLPTITVSITGFTLSFWLYVNSSSVGNFLFDFATAPNQSGNNMLMHINGLEYVLYPNWSTGTFVQTSGGNFAFNQWQHVCITIDPTKLIKIYVNSISRYSGVFSGDIFTNGVKTSAIFGATYLSDIPINGYVDDFRTYPRAITADEVSLIYSQASLYYPLNVPDINSGNTLQVGEYSTGSYVYNGTLVGGATIVANSGSRVSGQGYLSLVAASSQHLTLPSVTIGSTGMSASCWFRSNASSDQATIFKFGNTTPDYFAPIITSNRIFVFVMKGGNGGYVDVGCPTLVNDNVWRHIVITEHPTNGFFMFLNGVSYSGGSFNLNGTTFTLNYLGRGNVYLNGGIDDFRFYNRVITQSEITTLYAGPPPPALKDVTSGAAWVYKPAVLVDSTETNYTVKSTEIALIPGTNSTYAVWTAPKSTNIRVDVSFADYHSRSAGVGFQMFKINNDNTFGSTLFPRTVTTLALTDAAPTNYLTVPSTNLSVSTGDKIYLRVDANGNSASASSVLATNIYSYSGPWS